MNKFTGKCIGGPKDGEIISYSYPEFQTFELDKDQCNYAMEISRLEYVSNEDIHKVPVDIKVSTFVYKFVTIFKGDSNGLFIPLDKWKEFHEKDPDNIASLTLRYLINQYPKTNNIC